MATFDASYSNQAVNLQISAGGSARYFMQSLANSDMEAGYSSSTQFTEVDRVSEARAVWRGTGLSFSPAGLDGTYLQLYPVAGNITSLTLYGGKGGQLFKLSDFSLDVSTVAQNGPDFMALFASNDIMRGGSGNDTLAGYAGNDAIAGGDGDDLLLGGSGADTLDGGDGMDTVSYADLAAAVSLSFAATGPSTAKVGTGNDVLDNVEGVLGGAGNDSIVGSSTTAVDNLFLGGAGNDTLGGGAGDDTLCGGLGIDSLNGGAGNDWVRFDEGASVAVSFDMDTGNVTVQGQSTIEKAKSFENAIGGSGNDTLTGNAADNVLRGGLGADSLSGGGGNDTLDGSDVDNNSMSAAYNNVQDTLSGGAGNDFYILNYADNGPARGFDKVVEAAGAGTDTVQVGFAGWGYSYGGTVSYSGVRGYQLDAHVEHAILDVSQVFVSLGSSSMGGGTSSETPHLAMAALGSDADNQLSVQDTTEAVASTGVSMSVQAVVDFSLYGGAGNDTLIGGHGNDMLAGGEGNDVMSGGQGNDSYIVDAAGDVVAERPGDGTDTVVARIDGYALAQDLENLRLDVVPGVFKGTGNAANNVITGNDLANKLNGQDGNDTLNGGDGKDTLLGGNGDDWIRGGPGSDSLDGGAGNDTAVFDGSAVKVAATLGATAVSANGLGTDTLQGFENLIGGSVGDALTGDAGANFIAGGGGGDLLQGAAGDDTLQGDGGNDTLAGGEGGDRLSGGAGKDVFDFNALSDLGDVNTAGSWDVITDFTRGQDKIDLSGIDASATQLGDQAFSFVTTGFGSAPAQVTYLNGLVLISTDTDAAPEYQIQLLGSVPAALSAADFVL